MDSFGILLDNVLIDYLYHLYYGISLVFISRYWLATEEDEDMNLTGHHHYYQLSETNRKFCAPPPPLFQVLL